MRLEHTPLRARIPANLADLPQRRMVGTAASRNGIRSRSKDVILPEVGKHEDAMARRRVWKGDESLRNEARVEACCGPFSRNDDGGRSSQEHAHFRCNIQSVVAVKESQVDAAVLW